MAQRERFGADKIALIEKQRGEEWTHLKRKINIKRRNKRVRIRGKRRLIIIRGSRTIWRRSSGI